MDARRAGETIRDDGRGRRDAGVQWRDAPARRASGSCPLAHDRRRATLAARSRPAAASATARGTATAGPACDTRVRRAHSRSHARPRAGRAGRASRGDGRRGRAGSRCGAVERVREDDRRRRRAVPTDRRKRRGRAARLTHTHAQTGRSRSRPRRCARPAAGRATHAGSGWGNAAAHARCAHRRAAPRAPATRSNTAVRRRNRDRPDTPAPHRMRRVRRQARPATRRRRRAKPPDSPSSFIPVSAPGSPSRTYRIQREPMERASIRDAACSRAAPPMPTAHTAPRPRVSRIQPSRYLRLVVQALGRGTPHWKQRPSHRAARRVRQGRIACRPRPGLRSRQVFDSSAYQPPARPGERPPREPSPASRPRRAVFAGAQRFGAHPHAAHRLPSRDGLENGAECPFHGSNVSRRPRVARAGMGKIPMRAQRPPIPAVSRLSHCRSSSRADSRSAGIRQRTRADCRVAPARRAPRVVSRVQRSVMPKRRPNTPHDAAAGCGAAGLKFASSRMTPHAPACTARRIIQPAGLSA